jgi:hypothetical protein
MVRSKPTQTTAPFKRNIVYIHKPQLREAESQTDDENVQQRQTVVVPCIPTADASTQLDEGVLFDFDEEVEPILEVLIGRVLSEAKLEVAEELFMDTLAIKRNEFEGKRNKEIESINSLEKSEMRRVAERDERIQQERTMLAVAKSALAKTDALKFSKDRFGDICATTLKTLAAQGAFKSDLLRRIETDYLPSIFEEAAKKCSINKLYSELKQHFVPELISEARERSIKVQ